MREKPEQAYLYHFGFTSIILIKFPLIPLQYLPAMYQMTTCAQKLKTRGTFKITTMTSMGTHMRKRGPAIIIGWRNFFVRRRPALNLIINVDNSDKFDCEMMVTVTLTLSAYPPRSQLVQCRPSMTILMLGLI